MRNWMIWWCALWMCWGIISAQQQERLVYRGKMGNYAVIENIDTGKVGLLKPGEKWGKQRLVKIGKEELLFVDSTGKEYRIAKSAETRPAPPKNDAPAYPWQKFADAEHIRNKLGNSNFRLAYYATPLSTIIEEWRRLSGVNIVIAPQVHLHNRGQLRVTLSSDEISLNKALDLVTTYLDLAYYLEPERVVIIRPGDRPPSPPDPQEKYWRGLQQAQAQLRQQALDRPVNGVGAEKMEQILTQVIDIDLERVPVEELAGQLQNTFACPVLVNARAINALKARKQERIIFLARAVAIKTALQQLCREYKLAWDVLGAKIYISVPEHIQQLHRQKQEREQQQRQWRQREVPLTTSVTLASGWYSFSDIGRYLQEKCQLKLVVAPDIWEENYRYYANGQAATLKSILDKIAAATRAEYVIEPGVLYLLRPDSLNR